MMLSWLRERRQRAKVAEIGRLTERLVKREPRKWRAIDQEVIKWPEAGRMWADEIRILKRLARHGQLAKTTQMAISQSAEQSLWGHCIEHYGKKTPGRSILAHTGLLISGHEKVHLESLLYALQALHAIGADEPAVVPLLKEVIEESKPPSRARLDAMGRGVEQALSLCTIREIPEDVPYRTAIRGLALNAIGKAAKLMTAERKVFPDYSASVAEALRDPQFVVRFAAVGAIVAMESSLPRQRLSDIAPHVLSVLRASEYAQVLGQYGIGSEKVSEDIARWERY